jgi:hypothetical protein
MKKLIILFLILPVVSFAQHRALRIDSLEVNDKNVTGFFNDLMSTDLMYLKLDSLMIFTPADSSDTTYITDTGTYFKIDPKNPIQLDQKVLFWADRFYVDSVYFVGMDATDADTFKIYDNGTNTIIDSDNPILLDQKLLSWASKVYIDSVGIYQMDATDADTCRFYTDTDSTYINSDNPMSIKSNTTFWGTISAATVTDRTEYIGEQAAMKLLDKINIPNVDKFKNEDDVFVLPYELRDKQYRSLSNCVSLLLAVAKSQQKEIELLKKQIKKVK